MKREYYKRYKYDNPWCPACDREMELAQSGCGDYDEQCNCDELYMCISCGWRLIVACQPHIPEGYGWDADDWMSGDVEEKLPLLDPMTNEPYPV